MVTFRIRAIDYIKGLGNNIDYFDTTAGNFGNYASTGDADTYTIADPNYPAKIGSHAQGEWYKYQATVPTTGTYSVQLVYSLGTVGATGSTLLQVDSAFLASFPVAYTGGWDTSDRTAPQTVSLTAGSRLFRHTMQVNTCDFWGYEFNLLQSSTASVDIPASYQFETIDLDEKYLIFENKFGDGVSQAIQAGINNIKRTYTVRFIKMTSAEAITLRNIFRNAAGVKPITWTPPLETQPLKFRVKSHTVNMQAGLIYSIGATLEQVY